MDDCVRAHGYGPVRTVVLVDRPGRVVARVDTDRGRLVVKAEPAPAGFVAEAAANRRLAQAGLPVPSVVAHHTGAPSYLIMRWVEGRGLTCASDLAAQRDAGRLLRRVHRLGGGPPYAGCSTWDGWMRGWLNHAVRWWQATGRAGAQRGDALWSWFGRLEPLLGTRGGELILFDGRPDHFLADGDRIAGVIDLAEVRSGDAAMDLAVIAVTDPDLLPGVLDGYRPTPDERQVFDRLIPFYLVLRRLAAAEWNLLHGDADVAERLLDVLDRMSLSP